MEQEKAVILLSGGVDSSTTLAIAASRRMELFALTVDYGQRHIFELQAAKKIAESFSVREHLVLKMDLRSIGGSALTAEMNVPKGRSDEDISSGIPVTYVPARNIIFLSLGLAWAESLGASRIFIGVNAVDYSGYPDCRPAFIQAFQRAVNLGTREGVSGKGFSIETPLINLTKDEIIRTGSRLGVDWSLTFSCYDPLEEGKACGRCDSCLLRARGFRKAGIRDPLEKIA